MPYKDINKERKRCRIKRWRLWGVVGDLEQIHERFITTHECDICKCCFDIANKKCMEHCHKTKKFRSICCNKCNTNMLDCSKRTTNKSGFKNIRYCKTNKIWVYQKSHYGKIHTKSFKTKKESMCYKFIYLLKLRVVIR